MVGVFIFVLLYFVSCGDATRCGRNQIYKKGSCELTCKNYKKPPICSRSCTKEEDNCSMKCLCSPGFVRNDDYECVPPHLCPQGECGFNETFKNELFNQRTCNNIFVFKKSQVLKRKPGCYCKPGFVKDKSGDCILPRDCPGLCPGNEVYTPCEKYQKTCQNRFDRNRVIDTEMDPGCRCPKGFIRNELDRKCILEKNCPTPVCPKNESFELSSRNCGICTNLRIGLVCPLNTKPDCYCLNGYLRNPATGKCVLADDCPQHCKDPNSEFSFCPNNCPITCQHPVNTKLCIKACIPGCQCKEGFILDENTNRCVPTDSCTNNYNCKALQNEELVQCVPTCPITCQNRFLPPRPCPLYCRQGCTCKTGFIRDEFTNKCIEPEDCPACSDPNEIFNRCNENTQRTCQSKSNCDSACKNGCCCIQGTIRDEISGTCVPETECPERIECKDNMHFEDCKNVAPGVKCDLGCVCNTGYVYDPVVDECLPIHEDSDETCDDPNAEFTECGSACPRSCSNMFTPQICMAMCKRGCSCIEGYVLNNNGTCILESDCEPEEIICPANQHVETVGSGQLCVCDDGFHYDDYTEMCVPEECRDCPENSTCNHHGKGCVKTCENLIIPGVCNDSCSPRCECNDGFVFNDQGDCVPINTCNPLNVTCPPHSKFSTCGAFCPKTCKNLMMAIKCIDVCVMGCICEEGYVLNSKNICVKTEECTTDEVICPTDQHYNSTLKSCVCGADFMLDAKNGSCVPIPKCGVCPKNSFCNPAANGCTNTCKNLIVPDTCNTPNQPRCQCNEGFVFDKNGVCIPKASCKPQDVKCPKSYSIFSSCGSACPKSCSNMFLNEPCVKMCVMGCECRNGYVLNKHNYCVRPVECEADDIKCPPNQHFQDIYVKDVRKRNCVCNAGYHFDNSTNMCIECTKCGKCPRNAFCNNQAYGCPKTCETLGNWQNCKVAVGPRCECKKGFVFNKVGQCEPIEKCDTEKVKCSDPNAIFSTCAPSCPQRCSNMYLYRQCDKKCNIGCVCKQGFVLNSKEICVKEVECLPEEIKCPGEQHFEDFYANGMRIRGCICNAGYFLDNATSTCVTNHKCGKCPENSFCNECATGCRKTCENLFQIKKCDVNKADCKARCECNSGFVFNKKNVCVPIGNCKKSEVKCPDVNAVFSPCPSTSPKRCLNIYIGETRKEYNNLCECKPGYFQNSKGVCVVKKHCMPSEIRCPRYERVDKSKCVCEPGFTFNANDSCIVVGVNKVCGENQEFRCGNLHTKDCDGLHSTRRETGCQDGCFCKKGFVYENRNSNKCIPVESCYSYCNSKENEIYYDEKFCGCIDGNLNNCRHCHPGCNCMESYVRNSFGKCIEHFI